MTAPLGRPLLTRSCALCGETFTTRREIRIFCSAAHQKKKSGAHKGPESAERARKRARLAMAALVFLERRFPVVVARLGQSMEGSP